MGYYIESISSNFVIAADKVQAAYEAVCELNNHNELKSGGSWPRKQMVVGPDPSYWFSWMAWNYHETCKDLVEVMDEVGFLENEIDADGNFVLGGFDQKTGNEEEFLKVLAKFAVEDSYIEFRGEEGEHWKYVVEDGRLIQKYGSVVYD